MINLNFSSPEISAKLYQNEKFSVGKSTIVYNCGAVPVVIGPETLLPRESSIFTGMSGETTESVVVIELTEQPSALKPFPAREKIITDWQAVYDIFPLPHLKDTQLYRSSKEEIGKMAFNLWFAAAGTDCGIHNEHGFLEVHPQIWGTGHMQKFHDKDESTIYQDIFMTPGFTHRPFCGENDHNYPHHRYFADTDCIWLAVEYYS